MTSASSSRSTTAPGVTARSVPTSNALRSVWDGIPPFLRTSRHQWRAPRATLRPPVSNARLSAAGLLARKLVGAAALITMFATNRARSASRQLRWLPSRSSTRCPTDSHRLRYSWPSRRNAGFCAHAGSAKRRSPLTGARSDFPARMRSVSPASRRVSRATLRGWASVMPIPWSSRVAVGMPMASPASMMPSASSSVPGGPPEVT